MNESESIVVEGRELRRVRLGEERHREESPCPECGAYWFDLHVFGCPVEECPSCGGALASCGCLGPQGGDR